MDGIYTLQVSANDISFNESGDEDYEVRFEVIGRPTISSVLNYPNPFTTATHFVFTVTGDSPPDQMKIQIYTVSGRVVRTIDLSELGPLHVGRNITDYAWDGTDDFGDRLARGVYLYRVFAKLNGAEIEHRETQADGYFTKGFGKMYLLR
jgi:flagellar hook assembly protein FlgD